MSQQGKPITISERFLEMLKVKQTVAEKLDGLSGEQLALVAAFIDQILACEDPDVVRTFLTWRSDPRIDSILDLAAELGDDARDQLLFAAEDLYSESRLRQVTPYSV